MSDDPLIRYLRQPSTRTFAALVRETRGDVLGAAYRVLGDRARAEDVTQEVYVKLLVLDLQPDEVRSGPGLLAQSAVNLAKTALRGEARRAAREREAAARQETPEEPLSPADAEAVRSAVGSLPEMLRAAVELRYFGGLKLADVAAQLGWPLRTVKHRLKQARDRLEPQLAAVRGTAVLLSLAQDGLLDLPTTAPSAALDARLERIATEGFESARIAGKPLIRWQRLVPVAAVLAVAVAVIAVLQPELFGLRGADAPPVSPAAETADATPAETRRAEREPRSDNRNEAAPERPAADVAPPSPSLPGEADQPTCDVEIRVLDPDGAPAPGAHVLVELHTDAIHQAGRDSVLHLYDALRGAHEASGDGEIRVDGVPVLASGIRFSAAAWAAGAGSVVADSPELVAGETCRLEIRLAPAGEVVVTVRDAQSGEPIRGARVLSTTESGRRRLAASALAEREDPWHAVTDDQGRSTLGDIGAGAHVIAVSAEGYAHTLVDRVRPGDTREIRLEPVAGLGTVVVRVRDAAGNPVANMPVELKAGAHSEARKQTTDSAGDARFDRVPAGVRHLASLDMTAWIMRSVAEEWEGDVDKVAMWAHATVADGETAVVQVGYAQGEGRVVVRILDESDRPVSGTDVRLFRLDPFLLRSAETDADGRAVFDELPAGSFAWSVGTGQEWDGHAQIEAAPGIPAELDVRIGSATVSGRVLDPDGEPLADARLQFHGAEMGQFMTTDAEGRFEVQHVPAGAYVAHAYLAGHASAFTEIEVVRDEQPAQQELRLQSGEPVEVLFAGPHATEVTRFAITAHGPHDLEISLGGELIENGVRARLQLAPGTYRIRAEHESGLVLEQRVTVERGNPVRVRFDDE